MYFKLITILPLLASVLPLAEATWHRQTSNWGCSSSGAPKDQVNLCKGKDAFFIPFLNKPICVSEHSWQPPKRNDECPIGWNKHKSIDCCVPPKVVSNCDCREGYKFNKKTWKCDKTPTTNKCKPGEWWHDRSKSCCDNQWEWNPPKAECPKPKWCPRGWFWHKSYKKCKPQTPTAPEPDCDEWDEGNQCCSSGPTKSPAPTSPPKPPTSPPKSPSPPQHPGYPTFPKPEPPHGHWKKRAQSALEPTESDKMYCPAGLHVCPVTGSGEYSWECLDLKIDLENCGGCASLKEGTDCTVIAHAGSVGCDRGVCAVYTCKAGFLPSSGGVSCVAEQ